MHRNRKKLVILSILLSLSALACTSIYGLFGISEGLCNAIGGRWIPETNPFDAFSNEFAGECLKPFSENAAVDEPDSEPVDEIASEPVDEIPMETCIAEPEEYAWDFANLKNEARNETKQVCWGDFIVRNNSSRVLYFKWFEYWDNGAMQDIGWMDRYQRLESGDEFSVRFETQTWSTGEESVNTFKKLIVLYDLPECHDYLVDEKYQELWDQFALLLSDPCR